MTDLLTSIQLALDLPAAPLATTEAGALPSAFAVTELACASMGAAGQAVARLLEQQTARLPAVSVELPAILIPACTPKRESAWSRGPASIL